MSSVIVLALGALGAPRVAAITRWLSVLVVLVLLVSGVSARPAAASGSDRSGPVLVRGAGFARSQGSGRVRALQRRLRAVGVDPGPVDGRFGPVTEAAVVRFQGARGLAVDGIVGPRTRRVLRAPVVLARGSERMVSHGLRRVRVLQRQLRAAGVDAGRVDGRFGPVTEAAVRRFQSAGGLAVDGIVGPRTARRLARAVTPARTPVRERARSREHLAPPAVAPKVAQRTGAPVDGADRGPGLVLVALAAIAVALVAVGGVSRRRRRGQEIAPARQSTPLAAAGGLWPATASIAIPRPRPAAMRRGGTGPQSPNRSATATAPVAPAATQAGGARPEPANPSATAPGPAAPAAVGAEHPPAARVRALGYVSVPRGTDLHAGADPQAQTIEAACAAREWAFIGGVRETEPATGKGLERPGLTHALRRLERGEAECLIVTELGRLTHSAAELGAVLDRLAHTGMRLVVLDLDIDTATASGQLVAKALTTVSGWEHQRLGQRTRKGLAAARASGHTSRPAVSDRPELVHQITTMRANGMTLKAIADTLNAQGEPTVRGGTQWRPSSVQSALGYKRPKTPNPNGHPNPHNHNQKP